MGNSTVKSKCPCMRPQEVWMLYTSKAGNVSLIKRSIKKIVRNAVPAEIQIDGTKPAAIKGQIIVAQEYLVWNTMCYKKYPDEDYAIKTGYLKSGAFMTVDFAYGEHVYDSLATGYQNQISDAYTAVKKKHIHTKYGSMFETGYRDSSFTSGGMGVYNQSHARKMAANGKTWKEILHRMYDNTAQYRLDNIGKVTFHDYCY